MKGAYPIDLIAIEDTPEFVMLREKTREPVSACHAYKDKSQIQLALNIHHKLEGTHLHEIMKMKNNS